MTDHRDADPRPDGADPTSPDGPDGPGDVVDTAEDAPQPDLERELAADDGQRARGVVVDGEGDRLEDVVEIAPAEARPPVPDEDETRSLPVSRSLDQRVPAWLDTATQYTWRGIVLVVGLSAFIYVVTRLYLVSLPIILALILATICVPPARRMERRGVPRLLAAAIVVIGGLGSLIGVGALMTPTFIEQGRELQPRIAEGVDFVLTQLEEGPFGFDRTEIEDLAMQAFDAVDGGAIASSVGQIAVAIGQGIAALALAIVLLFFFVKDGDQIVAWFIKMVPEPHRDVFRASGARGWAALSGFVRGTALVALVDAVGIGVGLFFLDVPAYLPLSVLIFFGGFIPVIGATITGILAVLVALASGGITTALIVAGIVLLVQQIESNVLQPTIMRRAVALHPVVVLGVLTAGAALIGIVGAFLAVPLAAVVAAVGNELRIRNEIAKQGGRAGPVPIGGPGVDPETVSVQFPEDTQIRAAAHRRRKERGPARRRRREKTVVGSAPRTTGAAGGASDTDERADDGAGGDGAGGDPGDRPRANADADDHPAGDDQVDAEASATPSADPYADGYDTTLETTDLEQVRREDIPDGPR
ncbi:MAG: AI-2E family transporter [Nitriliruptoraceae bacterium]|nr:AI-2E family transporter [Nitriliruptoraceae bacterium]